MFDEHFERSVSEVLYGASLLQLREASAKNLSCCHPGHFQRIYWQNLLAPITIELSCCQKWPVFLEAAISKGNPFLTSYRPSKSFRRQVHLGTFTRGSWMQSSLHRVGTRLLVVVWAFHPLFARTASPKRSHFTLQLNSLCPSLGSNKREMF